MMYYLFMYYWPALLMYVAYLSSVYIFRVSCHSSLPGERWDATGKERLGFCVMSVRISTPNLAIFGPGVYDPMHVSYENLSEGSRVKLLFKTDVYQKIKISEAIFP